MRDEDSDHGCMPESAHPIPDFHPDLTSPESGRDEQIPNKKAGTLFGCPPH